MTDIPTVQLECKKDGLQQRQDGTWKLTLTVNGEDMENAISTLGRAAMGTRYMVALAQIGDDEQPVQPEPPKKVKPPMTEAQRAGMLCADPVFQTWCSQAYPANWQAAMVSGATVPDATARIVRYACETSTRRALDQPGPILNRWRSMLAQFEADTGRMAERTR